MLLNVCCFTSILKHKYSINEIEEKGTGIFRAINSTISLMSDKTLLKNMHRLHYWLVDRVTGFDKNLYKSTFLEQINLTPRCLQTNVLSRLQWGQSYYVKKNYKWKTIFCEFVYVPAHDQLIDSPEITDPKSTASTQSITAWTRKMSTSVLLLLLFSGVLSKISTVHFHSKFPSISDSRIWTPRSRTSFSCKGEKQKF